MIVTMEKVSGIDLMFTAPPSKSYTHRALIAGALAEGKTTIFRPLEAEDTKLTAGALRSLGVVVEDQPGRIIITGCKGALNNRRPVSYTHLTLPTKRIV